MIKTAKGEAKYITKEGRTVEELKQILEYLDTDRPKALEILGIDEVWAKEYQELYQPKSNDRLEFFNRICEKLQGRE
jgi:hypothetical protein